MSPVDFSPLFAGPRIPYMLTDHNAAPPERGGNREGSKYEIIQ
ncbi:hypothetical protein RD1_0966 [Roseobacter denitrificans OCh 114]|uniref:Uncharacterized protein n=1 Tax=Roseobacter denitrificans (strain ATCC 33942 / OCh 114) TaxID=375451 RepID=Q16BL0_ROSDO|nr:hypothetical protein RD1_0966 [Roseobacter denitrificans OCh 114]